MTEARASGRQIARGATWMVGFKLLDRGIGVLSIFVLARLLAPTDFGLVAMALSVVALVELMGAFGFDSALIQRQDAERRHYDTAWTFNVLFGGAVAVILILLAVPAASFYGEHRLQILLPVLAGGALIGSLENIGTVAFRKELDFRKEFFFMAAKRIAMVAITIPLAYILRNFWALVAGIVAGKILSVFLSYRLHPYRPRLSLAAKDDLMHFSKWLFLSNLTQFLHQRAADFILGRYVGTHGLGIFRMASEIGVMPSTEIIAPLNRAAFPAYSQLANERDRLIERFFDVIGVIHLIAFPVSTGLFAVSEVFVAAALGSNWSDAVPVVRIAAATGLMMALQSNLGYVLMALNQPKTNALVQAALLAVFLPAAYYGSLHSGAAGAAVAQFMASALGMISVTAIFCHLVRIPVTRLLAPCLRPMVGSAVMMGVLSWTEGKFAINWSDAPAPALLAAQVGIGAVTFGFVVIAVWHAQGRPEGSERSILASLGPKSATQQSSTKCR